MRDSGEVPSHDVGARSDLPRSVLLEEWHVQVLVPFDVRPDEVDLVIAAVQAGLDRLRAELANAGITTVISN
jgi:hypothetical protein